MFDFLKRGTAQDAPVEAKASATGKVLAMGAGRAVWSARDTVTLTKSGFTRNPVGFRAVRMIAEAAAALPLILQDRDRRYDAHPVADLLARPNAAQGRAELLEAVYGYLLLSGDAYLEAVGDGTLPVELHALRTERMSIVQGADGWPIGYDYTVAGKKTPFHRGRGRKPDLPHQILPPAK